MSYAESRSEKVFIILATTILLYSIILSVIAQNTTKSSLINNTNLNVSLPRLYQDVGEIKQLNSFVKYNNSENAGLKITSNDADSLLFSSVNSVNFDNTLFETISAPIFKLKAEKMSTSNLEQSSLNNESTEEDTAAAEKQWNSMVQSKYKNGLIKTVTKGVKHIRITRYTKAGPLYLNVIEVNPSINSKIIVKPALAGVKLARKQRISNIVRQNDALVGINASFFKPPTGVPLGTMIINKEIITGPILDRVVLGIENNSFKMARLKLDGHLITEYGDDLTIDNVNQPRMLSSYVIIYSDRWGTTAPLSPKYGMQVAVEDGVVTHVSVSQLNIAPKGFVIVGPKDKLNFLKVGDKVNFKFTTMPNWQGVDHAVGGGPYLVKNGNVYIDSQEEKFGPIRGINPRTAVGYTKDNRLIMLTIDGRTSKSVGVSLYTLAKIMKDLGCYNAMNFDGGSSTQMVVNNRIVNYPTTKGGHPVSNGLIIKLNS